MELQYAPDHYKSWVLGVKPGRQSGMKKKPGFEERRNPVLRSFLFCEVF